MWDPDQGATGMRWLGRLGSSPRLSGARGTGGRNKRVAGGPLRKRGLEAAGSTSPHYVYPRFYLGLVYKTEGPVKLFLYNEFKFSLLVSCPCQERASQA